MLFSLLLIIFLLNYGKKNINHRLFLIYINLMCKVIFISQRIIKTEQETQFSLSNEWTELFNKFKDTTILPLHDNTDLNEIKDKFNVAGIIISGGNDVYNESAYNYYSNNNLQSKLRDEFEIKLIKFAKKNKIPLMGVCRGCQLIAYINDFKLVNVSDHVATEHKLIINNKSQYLNEFLDKTKFVNSYHDYGIEYKNENENIVVTCLSEDNNIESLEYKHDKILGIMWHPERNTSENYFENINLMLLE